jgi:hypothetical protein
MRVPSHFHEFTAAEAGRLLAGIAGGTAVLILLLQAAARLDLLPEPAVATLDHVVLKTKVRLATDPTPVRVVLLGDSSCLTGVDALGLSHAVGEPVLNLATLSYLDLETHGELFSLFLRRQSRPPATVVLLMNPAALRHAQPVEAFRDFLLAQLRRADSSRNSSGAPSGPPWPTWLGLEILRSRLLHAALPPLLPGAFGQRYGSTRHAARYLQEHRGSLPDPHRFDPTVERASAEYRLAEGLETASRDFRSLIPDGTRLLVGLTPIPESSVTRSQPARVRELLFTWAAWIGADAVLTNLAPVLPDSQFATGTHLNSRGAARFTRQLAFSLREAGAARWEDGGRDGAAGSLAKKSSTY